MKIYFLGTNGWYDTKTGNTLCILLETSNYYIILDAGNGIHKLNQYITIDKPVYLFISHFHLDHIIGLNTLCLLNFNNGLVIFGPEDIKKNLNHFLRRPFTTPISKLPWPVEILEVPSQSDKLPFSCDFLPLEHSIYTLGLRVMQDNKVLSFCTDTVFCSNAVKLSKNADLLITECFFKPGQINENYMHLNPESAARMALESNAAKLALVHFNPLNYPSLDKRHEALNAAKAIFENTVCGFDDMSIDL
ncbi:MAG: ribonuclease Z [bacterium]|nr:ribonuclease Z [bacterium]